nr:hydrogenase maturation protease [Ilumatobacteraceae bacterium]
MRVTIIGIGNPYRCDDAVGLLVARRLGDHFERDPRVRALELDGEPVRLVQAWEGADHVVVIDAVRSGGVAGTRHRFTADHVAQHAMSADVVVGGGHALGLGDAIDLASSLDRLPPALEIWAIEGETFEQGEGLSQPVADACETLIAELIDHVDGLLSAA